MSRVFANGPGDRGSIPCRVLPKTQKMVLDGTLLKTQYSRVKWSNPGNGVVPSPTPRCGSYWKREPLGHPWLRSPRQNCYHQMKAGWFSYSLKKKYIKLIIMEQSKRVKLNIFILGFIYIYIYMYIYIYIYIYTHIYTHTHTHTHTLTHTHICIYIYLSIKIHFQHTLHCDNICILKFHYVQDMH